jgi:shikimate 5-dehydrogenase
VENFIALAERLGVSAAVLAAMLWAAYRFATWCAAKFNWFSENVIVPVTTRHMRFMDEISAANEKMGDAVEKIQQSQETLVGHIVNLQGVVRANSRRMGVLEREAGVGETDARV